MRARWRRRRPDPVALEQAKAKLRQAEVGHEVAQALEQKADETSSWLRQQLIDNHVGPKFHDALHGGL